MVESYAVTVDQCCNEYPLSCLIAASYCLINMNASFAQILSAESITPSWQRPVWLKHPNSLSLCCVCMSHCPKVSQLVVVICCEWGNSSTYAMPCSLLDVQNGLPVLLGLRHRQLCTRHIHECKCWIHEIMESGLLSRANLSWGEHNTEYVYQWETEASTVADLTDEEGLHAWNVLLPIVIIRDMLRSLPQFKWCMHSSCSAWRGASILCMVPLRCRVVPCFFCIHMQDTLFCVAAAFGIFYYWSKLQLSDSTLSLHAFT